MSGIYASRPVPGGSVTVSARGEIVLHQRSPAVAMSIYDARTVANALLWAVQDAYSLRAGMGTDVILDRGQTDDAPDGEEASPIPTGIVGDWEHIPEGVVSLPFGEGK